MDKRTLIIIVLLALPLIALVVFAQRQEPRNTPPSNITAAPGRLPPTDGIARPGRPATLEEARERVKRRLEQLEKMTPEEWEAESRTREAWRQQPPVQRLPEPKAMREAQPKLPSTAR